MEPFAPADHASAALGLERRLGAAFAAVLARLATPEPDWSRQPGPGQWSIAEVCEHVTLANRYLLILVEKLAARARSRVAAGADWPPDPPSFEPLERLAGSGFRWTHPEHMAPREHPPRDELARRLEEQLARCLTPLGELPPGAGRLHALRMSVVDRRLDLYQYLYLIALHTERHAAQIDRLAAGTQR